MVNPQAPDIWDLLFKQYNQYHPMCDLAYKANSLPIQLNLSSQFYLQFHYFIGFCVCKLKRNIIIIHEDQHTLCTDMGNFVSGLTGKWWDRLSVLIGRTGTIYWHSWGVSNQYAKHLHLWTRWLYHAVVPFKVSFPCIRHYPNALV